MSFEGLSKRVPPVAPPVPDAPRREFIAPALDSPVPKLPDPDALPDANAEPPSNSDGLPVSNPFPLFPSFSCSNDANELKISSFSNSCISLLK